MGDFRSGLEKLRQQGSLSLQGMARIRARVDKQPDDEHGDEEWVRGYTAVSRNQPRGHRDRDRPEAARLGPPAPRTATTPQRKPARPRALPAVPKPVYSSPLLLRTATEVLAGLRRTDPRLLLSATDTDHLAPGVAAWLERDLTPTAVRHALTSDLPPEPLRRPAALLAHRLTAQLPPLPPVRPTAPPVPRPRDPFQTCDSCDRPFRAPSPGRCRDCRTIPLADPM
ncbi:hypothetical protein [Streptomyces massasporeus]|uniref:hypothetical protein n=1 Tax=Streptomyces massasporeus TaxID=67324 RepID=UPI003819110A